MTAAVSAMPISLQQLPDSTAEARKRRREILISQRNTVTEVAVPKPALSAPLEAETKRRKLDEEVVSTKDDGKPAKKPQMKYDPDVPMSKEEAAAWRREQRRKRNRESAAASRQRQRDRISELEEELEDWKTKVAGIMDRIKKLEDATGKKAPENRVMTQTGELKLKVVSPPSTPGHSPPHSPIATKVASSSFVPTAARVTPRETCGAHVFEGAEQEISDKMVSRQAVS